MFSHCAMKKPISYFIWVFTVCPSTYVGVTSRQRVNIWAATWDFQQCGMCNQQSLIYACTLRSLIRAFVSPLHILWVVSYWDHLDFLSIKAGYTGSSESTLVKLPHCWKSNVAVHIFTRIVPWGNLFLILSGFTLFDKIKPPVRDWSAS